MTADQLIAARRQVDASLVLGLSRTDLATESSAPLLSIKGLSVRFGGIVALDNVPFGIELHNVDVAYGPTQILQAVDLAVEEHGITKFLVEQNIRLALELADHAYLIETGCIVMDGPSEIVACDDAVRRAYLGY
jgi:ABC-type branched-subunit amino acid transport system ATPase component